jgi:hypothetical protein
MATINLGSIKFNWKGAYAGGTAYVVDDVVSYNGSSYVCILASTGNLPTDATYFEQMSAKGTDGTNGTDGTDLTTTLTTQGDILYRDGSGLQRLGAGTSGQVLQTNGTGANPSWSSVSSDYVKITSGATSSVVSQLDLSNIFSTTYNHYKIIFRNLAGQAAGWIEANMLTPSGVYTVSDYIWLKNELSSSVSGTPGNNPAQNFTGFDNKWFLLAGDMGNNTGYSNFLEVDVFNPKSTSNSTQIVWRGYVYYHNFSHNYFYGAGTDNSWSTECTGLRFRPQNNFASGVNYSVYGIK